MMYGVRWLLSAKGRLVTLQELKTHLVDYDICTVDNMIFIIRYKTHQDCAVVYPYHTVYYHNEQNIHT